MKRNSEFIPLEIQEEILKRLPLKPLIQFRSVSKSFKSLIDNPDFFVSYGVNQPLDECFILRYLDDPCEKIGLTYVNTYVNKFITLVDNDDSLILQKFTPTVPDLIEKLKPYSVVVVGSSHGLLCFRGYYEYPDGHSSEKVVLWNLSIRKSVGILVPPYIYNDTPNNVLHYVGVNSDVSIGFGVCPVTFAPTVFKIDYKIMKVRVFSLSTRTWSVLSTNFPRESIRLRGCQVVIGRFIYWAAFDMLDAEESEYQTPSLIMSFDLTAKEFKEINLPGGSTNRPSSIHIISKLRESLVLLEYHTVRREYEEDISPCYLWMMKEQGVSRSFTKLYTIDLSDYPINRILGFRKTDELIIERRREYRVIPNLKFMIPTQKTLILLGFMDLSFCTLRVPIWKHYFCLISLMVTYIPIVSK